MEAGEYGLTRGTCFVARSLELVTFAGLLWISCCALGGAELFMLCVSLLFFFFERAPTACCKFEAAMPHLPLYYSKSPEAFSRFFVLVRVERCGSVRISIF